MGGVDSFGALYFEATVAFSDAKAEAEGSANNRNGVARRAVAVVRNNIRSNSCCGLSNAQVEIAGEEKVRPL
eukprot:CAMPEP_0183292616 /NCGR_PEP_ID=MMETSP0160_2-20130417/1608_1 /TAXON_ID=2839 ORGANISM="Odontella Sinensis, Strain Grunow 1884" /NCGR_SAMPLE_ID=MMETSP0160_2 /ASSEMBLY_ACC=CAM_ASM_000250 /LENGTH=71 /DNA_ID=CAMNT_0025453595 /DNA_START=943 /DNA_END=1155 /DNA_ORIENTATION=-